MAFLDFSKGTKAQLLPKDILKSARMISGQEMEKQIMDAVKRRSVYTHSNNTMMSTIGSTSNAIPWPPIYSTSTVMYTSYATSG